MTHASLRPPANAPAWRLRLFEALHSRRAHTATVAASFAVALLNLAGAWQTSEAARGLTPQARLENKGLLDTLFKCHALAAGRHRDRATGTQLALTWASVALLCVLLAERCACALAVGPSRFLASPLHALDALLLAAVLVSEAVLAGAYEGESEAVGLAVVLHLLRVGHDLGDREEADARIFELEARLRELEEGGKGAC